MNNPKKLDSEALMTMRRAEEYTRAAKLNHPAETLMRLAELQQNHIYRTSSGELKGAIEMSPAELTECLLKCRKHGFSNCDIQAMEVALHLRHKLGISGFSIVSNQKLSHNYVVLHPSETFPKGAIVDSWTGQGVLEMNLKNKLRFQHREGNYQINENMHKWVEEHGAQYVLRH